MDYTAIIVSLISLIGLIFQSVHNGKLIKRNDIKEEVMKTHKKLDVIADGLEYSLQDRLQYLCLKQLERGHITANELKMLTNMYHAYHNLGGNDFITDLFERVKELPVEGV